MTQSEQRAVYVAWSHYLQYFQARRDGERLISATFRSPSNLRYNIGPLQAAANNAKASLRNVSARQQKSPPLSETYSVKETALRSEASLSAGLSDAFSGRWVARCCEKLAGSTPARFR